MTRAPLTVLGVDGRPGGWVGVLVDGDGLRSWASGSFCDMLALGATVTAVDIPIGLPVGGRRRAADVAARQSLGPQRSSVFFTPPRAALAAHTHQQACELSRAAGSTGVSIQTFGIMTKIAEVDDALRDPAARSRVVEVHPEVSYRELSQGRPLPPKRRPEGRRERLALLQDWLPGIALPVPRPLRATPDDCLDALVCAWTGLRWLRGQADVLGGGLDATGLPMRIVV